MEREQFTFYASFAKAARKIRKPAERCAFYDALIEYAMTGEMPQPGSVPDVVEMAMELVMPVLNSARRKAEAGRSGGKSASAKTEAKADLLAENPKQGENASKKEGEDKKEDKKEGEKEKEKENECSFSPPAPSAKKQTAHQRSANGWVKLTDEQYSALLNDLGADELARCIVYVDELAQSTGNKNGWKDWNLVLRRCSREGWGKRWNQKTGTASELDDSYRMIREWANGQS